MFPYEKLDAHKVLHELAIALYRATDGKQDDDVHEIIAHLRWAAIRAPAKLAHGSVRGRKVFIRFVGLVMGYLMEISYLLKAARDLCLIAESKWQELDAVRGRATFYTNKLWEDLLIPEPPAEPSD